MLHLVPTLLCALVRMCSSPAAPAAFPGPIPYPKVLEETGVQVQNLAFLDMTQNISEGQHWVALGVCPVPMSLPLWRA